MARSTFVYAFAASQLALAAAFTSMPPRIVPRFQSGAISSSRSPPPSSQQTAARRRISRIELGGVKARRKPLTVGCMAPLYHAHEARCVGSVGQGPANESVSGLSDLELQRKHHRNRNNIAEQRAIRSAQPATVVRLAAVTASALLTGLAVASFVPGPAAAAIKAAAAAATTGSEEVHLHVGQKIANFFRRGGLPDWATLMTISAMPVVELRGGVPVGIWMGMPIAKVFGLCVAGNMIPIPIILLALRSSLVQRLAKPVLKRAREKAAGFGDEKSQALALTLFVGIPLPGTGAWTGAMGAFLLGMPFRKAMLSIFLGVVSAGMIMSCLTLAGKAGALLATAVLAVFCVTNIVGGGGGTAEKASDFASK